MYLEYDRRFCEFTLHGKVLTTRTGTIGKKGTSRVFTFKTAELAQRAHDTKLAAEQRRGFDQRVLLGKTSDAPNNLLLEATLCANRDDGNAYDVYADWLQANGSSLGELIALHRAKKKGKRVTALEREYGGVDQLTEVTWKWGLWDSLDMSNWNMDTDYNGAKTAAAVFGHPACVALSRLVIRSLEHDFDYKEVPFMVAAAKKYPWAQTLESLALVKPDGWDTNHHVVGDIGAKVSASFPNIKQLEIVAGEQTYNPGKTFSIAKLDLPKLEELRIESCAFKKPRVKELFAAKLPALTSLEVWFGEKAHDVTTTLKDLAPLLGGNVFPNLTKLGLCNAEFEEELARTIHTSPLAGQLVSLSLSHGTLDDASAAVLAANAKQFPKLERLDVSRSFLTPKAVQVLKRAFRGVVADDQRELDSADEARYVAVGE